MKMKRPFDCINYCLKEIFLFLIVVTFIILFHSLSLLPHGLFLLSLRLRLYFLHLHFSGSCIFFPVHS